MQLELNEDEAKAVLMAVRAKSYQEATYALDLKLGNEQTARFYDNLITKIEQVVYAQK